MISLSRLEGFYRVASTGGYAKAARAFPYPITQPAVHQQVKKLEAEIGARLFERVGRDRMRLTTAGRRLFDAVAPFLESLPDVVRAIRGGPPGGVLTVQAAPLLIRDLLPGWVPILKARHPEIRVDLHEAEAPAIDGLLRGTIDLVFDYLPEPPPGIATRVVATLRAWLVVPRNDLRLKPSRSAEASFAALAERPFVGYSKDSVPGRLQLAYLARVGIDPPKDATASNAETILGFVAAGLGWSLVPSVRPGGPRVAGVATLPLEGPGTSFPVVAAWRSRKPLDPLLEATLATLPEPN